MDPNDWTLTGNVGTDPTTNFLGTTDNEPLVINPVGNVNIGTFDSVIPYPKLTVTGPDATVNVETAEILRVMRHGVPGVKNQNSAGFFVGAFEPGINGRSRLDINVAGTPGPSNTFGSVPDVTVMTLQGNGSVGVGTTNPTQALQVTGQGFFTSSSASPDPGDSSGTGIRIGYQSTDDYGYINANTTGVAAKPLILQQNGGNVGIGTTSPGSQLEVRSDSSIGVFAVSKSGVGMWSIAQGQAAGVVAESLNGTGILALGSKGGDFTGEVDINGNLTVSGNKFFKIDHPLDAAKKYLYHASVESPDMKNIYDGVVVLDAGGKAEVILPAWFEALNTDFRYQLTAIGAAGPDLYIAEEMSANRFKIAGGRPNMKVCWQMTGVRQDAWAKANPLPVEQDKPAREQGYYLHPELYGESDEKSIVRARYPELEILRAR